MTLYALGEIEPADRPGGLRPRPGDDHRQRRDRLGLDDLAAGRVARRPEPDRHRRTHVGAGRRGDPLHTRARDTSSVPTARSVISRTSRAARSRTARSSARDRSCCTARSSAPARSSVRRVGTGRHGGAERCDGARRPREAQARRRARQHGHRTRPRSTSATGSATARSSAASTNAGFGVRLAADSGRGPSPKHGVQARELAGRGVDGRLHDAHEHPVDRPGRVLLAGLPHDDVTGDDVDSIAVAAFDRTAAVDDGERLPATGRMTSQFAARLRTRRA